VVLSGVKKKCEKVRAIFAYSKIISYAFTGIFNRRKRAVDAAFMLWDVKWFYK